MAIPGLAIIGESINDSVPSTKKLLDANDIDGILELARTQDQGGARYIDVNVGRRAPALMADLVKRIQTVTARPLAIDSPDAAIAEAGLKAYDPDRAGGEKPILNSISPLRPRMLDLHRVRPFRPILLVSERVEKGEFRPNRGGGEIHQTAKEMMKAVRESGSGIPNGDCIFDPGLGPVAGDLEGLLKGVLEAMALIHGDPDFKGVHMSVGLSNFTHMLPSKRADGSPVKGPLESAFLTRAMPLGLDMVVGSVKRRYETLPPDHPAMVCLDEVLRLESFDAIERIRQFYAK